MSSSSHVKKVPRLALEIIDKYAAEEPDRPYVLTPVLGGPEVDYKPVTFKALANAVNNLAHEISDLSKRANSTAEDFPTIAYVGPTDARYAIVMLACVKAHCKAFFFSPRNSPAARLSLFKATKSVALIYADTFADDAQEWLREFPMESLQALSLDDWLTAEPTAPFPYDGKYEEARWHPFVVVHTSGSTGIPKPVILRTGTFCAVDLWKDQPAFNGHPFIWNHWSIISRRPFVAFPSFHVAAVSQYVCTGLYYGMSVVFPPPDRIIHADLVMKILAASKADSLFIVPSVVEEIATTEDGIQALKKMSFVAFGGSALSPAVGNMLARRDVKLQNAISSTEVLPYHVFFQKDISLWNWVIINANSMGAEFRMVEDSKEPVFELVIRRLDKDPGLQTVFYTFPEKDEWSTGDTFKKHPTLPGHYAYVGRIDDVIVFSNGEKINPRTTETMIMGHPKVQNALVVGSQRFQPALLIEPVVDESRQFPKTKEEQRAFIDEIWPAIEEANRVSPTHGKIVRRLVVMADPEMPFPLSMKRTIQRKMAVDLYKDFIDDLYNRAGQEDEDEREVILNFESVETLSDSIVDLLRDRLDVVKATPESDLFSLGFDSLQLISLHHLIQSGLQTAGFSVTDDIVSPRVIYAHFVPKKLAEYLFSTLKGGKEPLTVEEFDASQVGTLGKYIEKYTSDLPAPNQSQADPLDDCQTVLITGTTGSLGAYMLDRLISNHRIEKIIALNRGLDGGASRQPAKSVLYGLSTDFSKVEFLGVDLSLPLWGLSKDVYDGLLSRADRIIHGAWPVNFGVSIETLEPFIRGVRHLVDFSNKAAKRVPIIFMSSVSTVDNWSPDFPVPEKRLEDLTLPVMGYGRSKAAASLILDAAAEAAGVPTVSIRCGLIVGPRGQTGLWNKQEFIPSLIGSSVYLGMLPDSIGTIDVIDWIPVEDVADIVMDLAGITHLRPVSEISGYFHCVNPNVAHWSNIALAIKEFYGERIQKIVSLSEWVSALEQSAHNEATDAARNPGLKLIDTYRTMLAAQRAGISNPVYALERTREYSQTFRNLRIVVDGDLMRRWCGQWQY